MNSNLTIKQRKLIAGVVSGMPKRIAAIHAGYSERSAHAIANETLKNPEVKKTLETIMDEKGISDNYIANKLVELAEAEANGNPHWPARARALDMMLKMKGHYSNEIETPKTTLTVEQAVARMKSLIPAYIDRIS